jgi:ABC-type glutathione transport system ATPase component
MAEEFEEVDLPSSPPDLTREISEFSLVSDPCDDIHLEVNDIIDHTIDVKELSRIVQEGNEEISSLQGMNVILIIGKTGVGKSSLIQMIHGVKLHRSPGVMAYEPVNSEMLLDDFKIGNIERSQTKSVRSYRCSFDKQLVFL